MKILPAFLLFLFLCSGLAKAGDEDQINKALKEHEGETYTLPAGTYTITDTILVPAGTTFKGEVSESGEILTKIILTNNARLSLWEPLIELSSDTKIQYLDIDANSMNQANVPSWKGHNGKGKPKQWGQGYHNIIKVDSRKNVEIGYLNLVNGLGDGARVTNSKNIKIHHNTALKLGHDAFYIIRSEKTLIHDNYVQPRINSAFRGMDVYGLRIFSNVIRYEKTYEGIDYDAGPAIQLQHDKQAMGDIEVCDNEIIGSCGPAFWIVEKTDGAGSLKIYNNAIYGAGTNSGISWVGGIIISGYDDIEIYNNVFDGCYKGAIVFYAVSSGWDQSGTAYISKNIFVGSVPGSSTKSGGYGVLNTLPHEIVSSENCFYDNAAGNTYGCSVSSSDVFVNPRDSDTPSDWSWNGEKWISQDVKPSDLQDHEGNYTDITDEEIKKDSIDFNDLFEIEISETGNIEQNNLKAIDPEWEKKGKTEAYIYLVGYEGQIIIGNETFIPKAPSECARVLIETNNLADRPVSQEHTLKLKDGANNSLEANLEVKTVYKVEKHKEILGFRIPYFKEKSQKASFKKTFKAPQVFPTFEPPKCIVRHYKDSHAIVIIPDAPGVVKTAVFLNNSSAREYRLIGEVEAAENGFKSTHFTGASIWKFKGPQMKRGSSGLRIEEPFNISDLKIEITTPYETRQPQYIEYIVIEDTSSKIFNLANLTLLVLILTYGRAIYRIFYKVLKRWL